MDEDTSAKWAAVAADYSAGSLTVAEICSRYAITPRALYARAKRERWPLRRPGGKRRAEPASEGRRQLIARLYQALERKMSEFELRLADGAQTAADHERDTRTLNTMVRLFERLSVLDEKAGAAAGDDSDLNADARALRADLAQRLERLRAGQAE